MDILNGSHAVIGVAWFWFSIPLIVTVFFRFGRIWSLRNFDLALLLAVAVGVVLVRHNPLGRVFAISWLFSVTGILLLRLIGDDLFRKRPRIETNLNPRALSFLGICGLGVLTTAIVVFPLPVPSQQVVQRGQDVLQGETPTSNSNPDGDVAAATSGPTPTIVVAPALEISKQVANENGAEGTSEVATIAAGILAGLAHLAVLGALVVIGVRSFNDWHLGLAAATLYVLLPSTVLDPNSVTHVLCAALILWALALHRVAWAAGILMGLACGSLLYPALLLPIWFVFYGRRRSLHFAGALASVWAVLLGGLALLSADRLDFVYQSLRLIARSVRFLVEGESPFTWTMTDAVYRVPILVTFVLLLTGLTFWPRRKRFEHLLAHTAGLIVAVQFWYPQQIGEYLTGYIPLVILVSFRPRLSPTAQAEQSRFLRRDSGERPTAAPAPARQSPPLVGAGRSERLFR